MEFNYLKIVMITKLLEKTEYKLEKQTNGDIYYTIIYIQYKSINDEKNSKSPII